jgi:hypothetical protein
LGLLLAPTLTFSSFLTVSNEALSITCRQDRDATFSHGISKKYCACFACQLTNLAHPTEDNVLVIEPFAFVTCHKELHQMNSELVRLHL